VGIAFAIGFSFGPMLGAYMTLFNPKTWFPSLPVNQFSSSAAFALLLLLIEIWYIDTYLPETLPKKEAEPPKVAPTLDRLALVHFTFLLLFSGMEFTLTFLTFERFAFSNQQQGKLLGLMGILSALIQGGIVRRIQIKEHWLVMTGILSCIAGFSLLGMAEGLFWNVSGCAFLAITSGTVVNGLTAQASREAKTSERGYALGRFRSLGQLGRSMGPIMGCMLYWTVGAKLTYTSYAVVMFGLLFL
jgi:MFS family permease